MRTKGLTIHLDKFTVAALDQLKRQMEAESHHGSPGYDIHALARHSIRKWCDLQSKPVPRTWELQAKADAEDVQHGN